MSPVLPSPILNPFCPQRFMTIPGSKLWSLLWQCETIDLRSVDNAFESNISGTDARALALSGVIEGVCVNSGKRVRYVRWVRGTAMPSVNTHKTKEEVRAEEVYQSSATAFARTNMGVYKQPLNEPIIEREFEDDPHVIGAGAVFAHAYAFCSLSRQEGRLVGL